jgi:hypothetical protein
MKNNFDLKPQPLNVERKNKEREFFRVLDRFVCGVPYNLSDLEFEFDMPWAELKKLLDKNCQYTLIDGVFMMASKEKDVGIAWRGKEFWADDFYYTLDNLECGKSYEIERLSGKFGIPWEKLEKLLEENCEYTLIDGVFTIISRKENIKSQIEPPEWFYKLRDVFFKDGKYHSIEWHKWPLDRSILGYAHKIDAIRLVGDMPGKAVLNKRLQKLFSEK